MASTHSNTNKVSLNPFKHAVDGSKAVFKTNFKTVLIVSIVSTLVTTLISLLAAGYLLSSLSFSPSRSDLWSLIGGLLLFVVLLILVSAYFGLATNFPILKGVARQKVAPKESFNFAWKRFSSALSVYFTLGLLAVGLFAVAALFSVYVPILGALLMLAFVVVFIVAIFRLAFIPFILVDKEQPGDVRSVAKRSSALWKQSAGAVVLYILTGMVLAIILSAILGEDRRTYTTNNNTNSGYSVQPDGEFEANLQQLQEQLSNQTSTSTTKEKTAAASLLGGATVIAVILQALVTAVITIIAYAGFADIYRQARVLADHK